MSGPIERVVVPLDAASENRTAIETAARLAARAKASLRGIFVEDEDLLRLARLPFARQVTAESGATPFTPEQAELYLRAAAERSRRDLLGAAKRHGVECSFETVRGADTALCAACERDLVVAGGLTRPIAGHFRVEARWWSSLGVASAPLLLARQAWSGSGSTVVVLRHPGPESGRLLDTAAQLAEARDGAVSIICSRAGIDPAAFDEWIAERLKGHSGRLQIETAPAEPAQLRQRIRQLDCGLLAVEADSVEGRAGEVRELVESFACDVLIVR